MPTKYKCSKCDFSCKVGSCSHYIVPKGYGSIWFGCCLSCGSLYQIRYGAIRSLLQYDIHYDIQAVSVFDHKLQDAIAWYENTPHNGRKNRWKSLPFILETNVSEEDLPARRREYTTRGILVKDIKSYRVKNYRFKGNNEEKLAQDALFSGQDILKGQLLEYVNDSSQLTCHKNDCHGIIFFGSILSEFSMNFSSSPQKEKVAYPNLLQTGKVTCPKCHKGVLHNAGRLPI